MKTSQSWPIPAYFSISEGTEELAHEPAILRVKGGEQLRGSMSRMLLEHGMIEFCPDYSQMNIAFPFDSVVQLLLTRPVTLQRRIIPGLENAEPPSEESQSFSVELTTGETIRGSTTGFEVLTAGLFLFIPKTGNTVQRLFIPDHAIKAKQIGQPIGEILAEMTDIKPEQVRLALEKQSELREQKLGDCLTDHEIISIPDLKIALERQKSMPMLRLGEALQQMNYITAEQLNQALAIQKENRKKPLGEVLVDMGLITAIALRRALTQKLGIPFIDLKQFIVDPVAVKSIAGSIAREFCVLPVSIDDGSIIVAMSNPLDGRATEKIKFSTGLAVIPVMAEENEISVLVGEMYQAEVAEGDTAIEDLASRVSEEIQVQEVAQRNVTENDNALVRLVNKTILDAHSAGASDIHIECSPGKGSVAIRFRKDGVMHDYVSLPAHFRSAIVSRLKIMGNLDISEHRRGQDGRIAFHQFGPANIELRMAVIPTLEGLEDVVLRILAGGEPLPLQKLQLRPSVLEGTTLLASKSFGLLLVCGPTGSGKTTTLHSILAHINTPERKIWTAEDPVEISQAGLRQVQVNPKINWGFAEAMRAFLRADPDVIMVGEMRDAETAKMGVEASLTGHLVLSTLHTNSAPESIVRLLQLGIDPFNFADSLAGILAQRLTRKLCPICSVPEVLSPGTIDELLADYCHDSPLSPDRILAEWHKRLGEKLYLHRPEGCKECRQTGFKGRLGIHELLMNGPEVRAMIQQRATASEIRDVAIIGGMRTLKQDGIEKCLAGLTDIREVRAACS